MKYKIEKGIPIPPIERKTTAYPWPSMDVGDSVFIPQRVRSITPKVSEWGKRFGETFVVRKEGTGCRVWRTK